jgi:hypothetical protein
MTTFVSPLGAAYPSPANGLGKKRATDAPALKGRATSCPWLNHSAYPGERRV